MTKKTHIEKSYRIAIVIVMLIVIAFLSIIFKVGNSIRLGELLIGLPMLTAGIMGIVGFIQWTKGRKENSSLKKTFALLINSCVVILLIVLVITNVIDIINAFN